MSSFRYRTLAVLALTGSLAGCAGLPGLPSDTAAPATSETTRKARDTGDDDVTDGESPETTRPRRKPAEDPTPTTDDTTDETTATTSGRPSTPTTSPAVTPTTASGLATPATPGVRTGFGDPARTRQEPISGLGPNLALAWKADQFSLDPSARPIVTSDSIYVEDANSDQLLAVNLADGQVRWAAQFDNATAAAGTGVYADGTLFFANDRALTAVDTATGTPRWKFVLPDSDPATAPVVAGQRVFVISANAIYGLNRATGAVEISRNLGYKVNVGCAGRGRWGQADHRRGGDEHGRRDRHGDGEHGLAVRTRPEPGRVGGPAPRRRRCGDRRREPVRRRRDRRVSGGRP